MSENPPKGERVATTNLSALERKAEKIKRKLPNWVACLRSLFQCIWDYFCRLFTVPLQRDPIYFHRPGLSRLNKNQKYLCISSLHIKYVKENSNLQLSNLVLIFDFVMLHVLVYTLDR